MLVLYYGCQRDELVNTVAKNYEVGETDWKATEMIEVADDVPPVDVEEILNVIAMYRKA